MIWLLLVGFVSGIVSGLGIGGGAILIPALGLLFAFGQREAQNLNLLYFLPTAAVALVTHRKEGNIEKKGLWKLILLGLIGAAAGALIAVRIDAGLLRKGFGVFLFGISAYEFTKGWKNNGTDGVRKAKKPV